MDGFIWLHHSLKSINFIKHIEVLYTQENPGRSRQHDPNVHRNPNLKTLDWQQDLGPVARSKGATRDSPGAGFTETCEENNVSLWKLNIPFRMLMKITVKLTNILCLWRHVKMGPGQRPFQIYYYSCNHVLSLNIIHYHIIIQYIYIYI